MVKGNQVIPNQHFRKHWFMRIRTWFNQPARKERRRRARADKAAAVFPRPLGQLRPAVHAPTVRYNTKVRLGRGFTKDEVKGAGLTLPYAKTIGIALDHRRRNASVEVKEDNVQRLKQYLANITVFPRKVKAAEYQAVAQNTDKNVLPIAKPKPKVEARAITEEDKKAEAYSLVRKLRADVRLVGVRQKLKEKKAKADE
ncbi:60S large subunit ribosomal protein eL13 (rpL13) [Andalucia godoyi]|uniref:60S large subunit ribosomal protein eL13 (RpL13) n=1 Tax=Andalucia godoyi TaxID=505711 RepID=A0A8K0F139_ANDGO|nr:60S large subunit ribosomal protein eL13 (rpL13) [Andalucia godoyi]|eukprot:ANDGO_02520.mRNA.1 60S large subunit ribosomal protein eL13 (rpL13)